MRKKLVEKIVAQGILDSNIKYAPLVTLEDFFEGNTDEGSIGCNLSTHPGATTFYKVLLEIRSKPTVLDVLVEVTDLEEEEEFWPFSERVYILTSARIEDIAEWTIQLEPTEIDIGYVFEKPPLAPILNEGYKVVAVWWD